MSEYIKICRGGSLELYKQDDELCDLYNYHKLPDGNYRVINRKTKETVEIVDDERKAIAYRCKKEKLEISWNNLRLGVWIEDGATLGDLLEAFSSDDLIDLLLNLNFPFWNILRPSASETEPEKFLIRRKALLENSFLEIIGDCNRTPSLEYAHLPVEIEEVLSVGNNAKEFYSGDCFISFLDLFEILFAPYHERGKYVFEKGEEGIGFYDDQKVLVDEPLRILFGYVKLGKDVCLRDVFEFMESQEDLRAFISMYSWCLNIDKFHSEAKKPAIKDEFDENIYELRISHCCNGEVFRGASWVNLNSDFGGRGKVSKSTREWYEGDHCPVDRDGNPVKLPEYENYAVEMTPVNKLADLPLVLDDKVELYRQAIHGRKGGIREQRKSFGEAEYPFTVVEFLDAIYDEISFFGDPENRDAHREEISSRVEECKKNPGKTYTSVDEMLKDLEEQQKEEFGPLYKPESEEDEA